MTAAPVDAEAIRELFGEFGPVAVRRMFGGAGVFADGLMIAIVSDGTIFLKADDATSPAFAAEGCDPFAYATRDGRRTLTSYWRLPERLYDDPDELAGWARDALAVARRAAAKPAKKRKPR